MSVMISRTAHADSHAATTEVPPAFCIESSVGYQMRSLVALYASAIEREMEPLGITDAQWKPLLRLFLEPGISTVAGLARVCSLDAGAMTRMLDRLEAKNLCRRIRSLEDRRVVELELTTEGCGTAEQIPDVLERLQAVAMTGFDAGEEAQLMSFLARIADNLHSLQSADTLRAAPVGTAIITAAKADSR